jgi:hypothetical protein
VAGSIPASALKYKIMYETLEHWKQYKQEKDLQNKIAKEYKLKEAIKEANNKEFDKWMNDLIKRNGTTEY